VALALSGRCTATKVITLRHLSIVSMQFLDDSIATRATGAQLCRYFYMLSFQRLDVYQRATEFLALAVDICRDVTRGNAGIVDQLRRAALSIPLNIAEAAGRTGAADAARAYAIARGSAMECAAVLDALLLLKLVDQQSYQRGCDLLTAIVAMLTKLCRRG
jgi:four helix bundle protein